MVIEVFLFVGLAAAGAAAVRLRRRKAAGPAAAAPDARPRRGERVPWEISVGDVVSYVTDDFVVEAVLSYEDEGPRFREAHLTTDARLWVGPENQMAFTRPLVPPDGASALPNQLHHEGVSYRLTNRGSAFVAGARWQFADYEAPPGRILLLRQRHGGEVEAFAGEKIAVSGLLSILPGS